MSQEHNLIEVKALIAALAGDSEEMEVQVARLSVHELGVFFEALSQLTVCVMEAYG